MAKRNEFSDSPFWRKVSSPLPERLADSEREALLIGNTGKFRSPRHSGPPETQTQGGGFRVHSVPSKQVTVPIRASIGQIWLSRPRYLTYRGRSDRS